MAKDEVSSDLKLKNREKGITKDEELGGYTFTCLCTSIDGEGNTVPGFVSRGWPRKEQAIERKVQHLREHVTAEDPEQETVLAEPLEVFMERHGMAVNDRETPRWQQLLAEGEND